MSSITRHRIPLVTDTGGNASAKTRSITGMLSHMVYVPGDTGVRCDTGAVVTVTADTDTGGSNLTLFVAHLAPNDKSWPRFYVAPVHDTGGTAVDGAGGLLSFAGEELEFAVQGVAADTGKEPTFFLYTFE